MRSLWRGVAKRREREREREKERKREREREGGEWRGEWRSPQSHTRDQAVDSTTTLPRAQCFTLRHESQFGSCIQTINLFHVKKRIATKTTSGMNRRIASLIVSLALVLAVRSGMHPCSLV